MTAAMVLLFPLSYLLLDIGSVISACSPGQWFGASCEYQCHCAKGGCRQTGLCNDELDQCAHGWFDHYCRDRNLISDATITADSQSTKVFSDNVKGSCWDKSRPIRRLTIKLKEVRSFTWMKYVLAKRTLPLGINLTLFYERRPVPCPEYQMQTYWPKGSAGDNVVYVSCGENTTLISDIILTGSNLSNLCEVYINGGFNVALKQQTKQGPRPDDLAASKVVDGVSDDCDRPISARGETWWWEVTLARARHIISYTIHGLEHQTFTLTAFGENGNAVFNFRKEPKDSNQINAGPLTGLVRRVRIDVPKTNTGQPLRLCEVEIFSYCPLKTYGMDCQPCNPNCMRQKCHKVSGACSSCAVGIGSDCKKEVNDATLHTLATHPDPLGFLNLVTEDELTTDGVRCGKFIDDLCTKFH